jgi:hypothetical protein
MSHRKVDELTKTVACEPGMRPAETSGIPANEHPPQSPLPPRARTRRTVPAHRPKSCKPIWFTWIKRIFPKRRGPSCCGRCGSTMSTFVDLAFGLDPVHQAQASRRAHQSTGDGTSSSRALNSNSRADDTQGNSTSAKRGVEKRKAMYLFLRCHRTEARGIFSEQRSSMNRCR